MNKNVACGCGSTSGNCTCETARRANNKTCRARQHSDQMLCDCGLGWDVNDPDPPECRSTAVATQQIAAMRVILQEPSRFASVQKRLLKLQEMPLNWLPVDNIEAGLYLVHWASMPEAVFVLVDDVGNGMSPGKHYRFFTARGRLHLEVKRSTNPMNALQVKHTDGGWLNEA